ncbi:MAG: metal-dependent hydrolase [Candidatus Andeanibacterium colombiense]|uniref:Metal-dependent hydrolase n=1 Tax=Candidatus Andeanibacterium colombiense TaxID=3121345 RepID=A0AAJ5XB51_9SPHN|nr:MAG: metal-dependent hydrolase [Sphingomonadaceae bacterium]
MSAPFKFDLEAATPLGKETPTPGDLAIVPRNRRFCRGDKPDRWWMNGDPVATAWHNGLSVSFPIGEAFFIEHVKANRDGVPPQLETEIRAFVKQEINHTREHVAFNRAVAHAGYDISGIEERLSGKLAISRERPSIVNLGASMALEHLTALIARHTLTHADHYRGARGEAGQMWRWHMVEEIEHKGVAYDTWLHATRDWSRWKRWKVKSLVMLIAGRNFVTGRIGDALDLMEQDGLAGWRSKWRLANYLVVYPGVLRKIAPAAFGFFLPGFHPWNRDDRALIALYDSEFIDAVLAESIDPANAEGQSA